MSMPIPPCPADFTVNALQMSRSALRKHYRCGAKTVDVWCKERGLNPHVLFAPDGKRAMPADFVQNAHLPMVQLTQMYSVGSNPITRWRREIGWVEPSRKREVPADFDRIAPTLTLTQCAQRYTAANSTVKRWYVERGLTAAVSEVVIGRSVATISNMGRAQPAAKLHDRAYGPQDAAADVLRSERWPVYRCKETGRADAAGKWWRVGNVVCDGDELLARAAKYARAAA